MYKNLLLVLLLMPAYALVAQGTQEKLAMQYYEQEKFDLALPLYEDLSDNDPTNLALYDRYLNCLLSQKEYDKAEKMLRKRIRKFSGVLQFAVDEGYVLEKQNKTAEADKIYDRLVGNLGSDFNAFSALATAFERRGKLDKAIQVYEKGEQVFEGFNAFGNQLAMLYMQTGNRSKGVEKYVNLVLNSGMPADQSKQMLEMNITDSADFAVLRVVLLRQIQKMPDNYILGDLLKWTFIKQKDWNAAFVQSKALDKRLNEEGARMIELGEICMSNEAWDVATKCFAYVKDLGPNKSYFYEGVSGYLETRFYELSNTRKDSAAVVALEKEYLAFLNDAGYSERTWRAVNRLADIYLQFEHKPEPAINLLEKFVALPGLRLKTQAEAKLALGDAYVIDHDVWSSELMYAQVEKDFPEEAIGQEAKFRRARLSYFRGDFDWARIQLDVLKGATTQLIANNAMELALTISENLGIDSNYHALGLYANAALLIMQQDYAAAEMQLDSIIQLYPGHSLSDDILYARAQIREKQGRYAEAAELYETLAIAFSHDLLADNAWFRLGDLYEHQLHNPEAALKAYGKIVLDFPGSLFQPEARKRFRLLRGDNI